MKYFRTISLPDGSTCTLRNATEEDSQGVLDNFILTHEQTDFLTTYPDEIRFTIEEEARFLKKKAESENEVEIIAEVDGLIVGCAGIESAGIQEKRKHRAEYGISIDRKYWGLGIGRALTEACIECARNAGYSQLELSVVAENDRAISLYRHAGFVEYGRNPRGFRSRMTGWQELVLMRLELNN